MADIKIAQTDDVELDADLGGQTFKVKMAYQSVKERKGLLKEGRQHDKRLTRMEFIRGRISHYSDPDESTDAEAEFFRLQDECEEWNEKSGADWREKVLGWGDLSVNGDPFEFTPENLDLVLNETAYRPIGDAIVAAWLSYISGEGRLGNSARPRKRSRGTNRR